MLFIGWAQGRLDAHNWH